MNIALLKLAKRHSDGSRRWSVPGFGNAAVLRPQARSAKGWGPSFSWPRLHPRDGQEAVYSLCLWRHRDMARRYAREMIAEAGA